MKKSLLCFLILLMVPLASMAYDFEVDGIYYKLTGSSSVAVTYKVKPTWNSTGSYSGHITIPSAVNHNNKSYAVTSIGDSAFYCCSSLTSITIPESVTSMGSSAFEDCSSLTSITIPKGVTAIGYRTFSRCSNLTSITIPEGVTSIGEEAFSYCKSLTSITIPERVTSIGDEAFDGCSGLTSVICKSKKPASCIGFVFSSYQPRLIIPIGSEEAYASATEWKYFTNRSVFKTFDHAVTTFADAEMIDLDNAYQVGDEKTFAAAATKDLKAYQFTGSAVNGTIKGTEVNGIVPAGTGLLMTGTEGATYVFPLTSGDATADVSGNKLVGVTKDTDLSTLTDGNNHYVYDNDGFWLQSTGTIAANKAYLSLPTAGTDKINVSLDGTSTGIKGIAADNEDNGAWYTLDGVKVNEKPTAKGLYIHHGKKVIVNKQR